MSIREFNTQFGSIKKQGAWIQALCQHRHSELKACEEEFAWHAWVPD